MHKIITIAAITIITACHPRYQPEEVIALLQTKVAMKYPADTCRFCFRVPIKVYENKVRPILKDAQKRSDLLPFTTFDDTIHNTCRVCIFTLESLK